MSTRLAEQEARPQGAAKSTLRAGALSGWQIAVLSAALVGPAAGVALNYQFIAQFAGAALPLTFVVATIVIVLMVNTVVQFTRRVVNAGSYYAYASYGLNTKVGFLAAWALTFAYIGSVPAGLNLLGLFISDYIKTQWSVTIPWEVWFVLALALVTALAYFGVRGSAKSALVLLAFEVTVLVALSVTILAKVGVSNWSVTPFKPSSSPTGLSGLALGLVYACLSIIGWEAGATFSEEAKDPRRSVGRGILGAALLCSGFFLLTGYAATIGFGVSHGGVAAFQGDATPLQTLTTDYWGNGALFVTVLASVTSILGFVLAAFNGGVRIIYALAREGLLARSLAHIHPRHRTPGTAILFFAGLDLVIGLALGLAIKPVNVWGYFGFMSATAILATYLTINLSLVVAAFKRFTRSEFSVIRHIVFPAVASFFIGYVFKNLFYPVPASPYRYFPYAVLVYIALGAVYVIWLSRRQPELLPAAAMALEGGGGEPGSDDAGVARVTMDVGGRMDPVAIDGVTNDA